MSDLIKIKGGSGDVPLLQDREIAYSKDKKALYIGTGNGNVLLCNADDVLKIIRYGERLTALEGKDDQTGMFYATHGVTTGEEINEAFMVGKAIACKLNDGRVLYLTTDWGTGKGFTFSSAEYTSVFSVEVDGEYWTEPVVNEFVINTENQ